MKSNYTFIANRPTPVISLNWGSIVFTYWEIKSNYSPTRAMDGSQNVNPKILRLLRWWRQLFSLFCQYIQPHITVMYGFIREVWSRVWGSSNYITITLDTFSSDATGRRLTRAINVNDHQTRFPCDLASNIFIIRYCPRGCICCEPYSKISYLNV